MKRTIIAFLFLIIGCKEEKKEITAQTEPKVKEEVVQEAKPQVNESGEAQKWLEKSIEDYFKADIGNEEKAMRKITTKDYFDYKTDAMNVDMDVDGSLTEKEFEDKWKTKFNTKQAGIGVGFLISGQDWTGIKVAKCQLISENGNSFMFDVILSDKETKAEYPIKVKVSKENVSFLIADVLQEIPKFN
ncbi:hypothetical protein [Chryseobacterium rhizosphaerae]|uniref:Uncharacterized protein n=1 Tax=Chryseobacterium rhizosphaerae TaxID=395937 RepID=A0ABX9INY7_9FLAO|nr:hypothetical protein [Chryseobacterium rhizosphaerae]REC77413.1 hypothetical protein DRF57_05300 [Chryseobacterium rhizosphaerae]GEN65589.1 hypothetical protein CRH01_01570 [Chryseobacterium rhizosphaerae]